LSGYFDLGFKPPKPTQQYFHILFCLLMEGRGPPLFFCIPFLSGGWVLGRGLCFFETKRVALLSFLVPLSPFFPFLFSSPPPWFGLDSFEQSSQKKKSALLSCLLFTTPQLFFPPAGCAFLSLTSLIFPIFTRVKLTLFPRDFLPPPKHLSHIPHLWFSLFSRGALILLRHYHLTF